MPSYLSCKTLPGHHDLLQAWLTGLWAIFVLFNVVFLVELVGPPTTEANQGQPSRIQAEDNRAHVEGLDSSHRTSFGNQSSCHTFCKKPTCGRSNRTETKDLAAANYSTRCCSNRIALAETSVPCLRLLGFRTWTYLGRSIKLLLHRVSIY